MRRVQAKKPRDEPRNPAWVRDEEILLLDLYLRHAPKTESDPRVVALSGLLNVLPIHVQSERASTFRNPTGVFMKLGNLRHIDPSYPGRGLGRANRVALEVWHEFAADPVRLSATAAAIERAAKDKQLADRLEIPANDEQHANEGRVLFRLHRIRERQPRLVRAKKREAVRNSGRLVCEVCGVDVVKQYGPQGDAAIECHHLTPLAAIVGEVRTSLEDLALVCASCHRVLHARGAPSQVQELRRRVIDREAHNASRPSADQESDFPAAVVKSSIDRSC